MKPLRHRGIKGDDQRRLNQSLYLYLFRRGVLGATDEELSRDGHTVATRAQLILKGVVFDSGRHRGSERVWTVDSDTPNHPNAREIMEPPSTVETSRYALGLGSPPHDQAIPQRARGTALALTAITMELLTGYKQRLAWIVDLKTDVVLTKDDLAVHPTEPGGRAPPGSWSDILFRLRAALDLQPWGAFDSELALWLHMPRQSTGEWVWAVFAVPWKLDYTRIPGRPPPVGRWMLTPLPPYQPRSMDREGDEPIGQWWLDGVPF